MTEPTLTLEAAETRVNEIAEALASGASRSKEGDVIELRRLCGKHRIVPKSYKLEGVEREGGRPQHHSKVTEIWKGGWNGKAVALKVLRVDRDDPHMQRAKSRFCREVAVMKQFEHDNILPFYGVSTTVSDFCLVFPWYKNGSVMDYLKMNPEINQFQPLSDAISGLLFLHTNGLVHGSLKSSHILVDDTGTARLATGGRTFVVTPVGSPLVEHPPYRWGDHTPDLRFRAPEVQWPEEHAVEQIDEVAMTKESDVYEVAMVAYEVLTRKIPYFKWNDTATLEKIRLGELPQKPSGIDEAVWEFLRNCWSRDPTTRPSTAVVHDTFLRFRFLPKFTPDPEDLLVTELPGKVKLQIQSIRVGLEKSKQQQFCVKLRYGNKDHTTPAAKFTDALGEHGAIPESWLFETNKQHHGQLISLELLLRTNIFKKVRVCATGSFSLTGNVNKQTNVKLEAPDGVGSAVLKVLLIEM